MQPRKEKPVLTLYIKQPTWWVGRMLESNAKLLYPPALLPTMIPNWCILSVISIPAHWNKTIDSHRQGVGEPDPSSLLQLCFSEKICTHLMIKSAALPWSTELKIILHTASFAKAAEPGGKFVNLEVSTCLNLKLWEVWVGERGVFYEHTWRQSHWQWIKKEEESM